jgi:uncharacterized protein YegP (UPF0339 family)
MYFVRYNDSRGEWRWNYRAGNHEDICVSSEGYMSKQGALHCIALLKQGAAAPRIYEDTTQTWS